MFNKRGILLLFLLVVAIATVSSVGAADTNNDTLADSTHEVTGADENDNVIEIEDSKDLSNPAADNVLREDEWATYTDLQEFIDMIPDGGSVSLSMNFYCDDDFGDEYYGITINKSMVIDGQGHTLDSCRKTGGLLIYADNVTIMNLNIINAYDGGDGAAAYVRANNIMFQNCKFINNTAGGNGGAINAVDFLVCDKCYFENNYAYGCGGAIYSYYPSHTDISTYITNSAFNANCARENGGAVYLDAFPNGNYFVNATAKSLINNTIFYNNWADYGGAVFNFQYTDVSACIFEKNHAEGGGGAIYMNNGVVIDNEDGVFSHTFGLNVHENTWFTNNTAGRYGGAIKIYANPVPLSYGIRGMLYVHDYVIFEGNSAGTGGALSIVDSNSQVVNALFRGNSGENGSAMEGGTSIYCIFVNNTGNAVFGTEMIGNQATLSLKQSGSYYADKLLTVTLINDGLKTGEISKRVLVTFSNGKSVTLTTDSNGKATYSIPFAPGTYTATARVLDNDVDANSAELKNIKISKAPIAIAPTKLSTTYASGKYFQIKVTNSKTKKVIAGVKLKLQIYTGKKYSTVTVTTGSNGIAKYDTSKLSVGTHKVVISNAQSAYFTGSKITSSIVISKASYNIIAAKVTNALKRSANFKITVKNKATGKVVSGVVLTVKVYTGSKYKPYTLKTNSKGIATLNTKSLSKGNHKIVITTKATANFKVASKSSSASITNGIKTSISYTPDLIYQTTDVGGHCHTYAVVVKVTLKDSKGNTLTKPVTVKHSDGSSASGNSGTFITVSGGRPGTLTLKFSGDNLYDASSCVVNLGNEPY